MTTYTHKQVNQCDYIKNDTHKKMILDGVDALNKLKLWDWLKNFEPDADRGFIFTNDVNLDKLHRETDHSGHSGVSFAIMMRILKRVANDLNPTSVH